RRLRRRRLGSARSYGSYGRWTRALHLPRNEVGWVRLQKCCARRGGASDRQEPVAGLEILERVLRHLEIGRQQQVRIGADPIGERDRLVDAVVEREQELDILVADVLDVVAVSLRHVADVAGVELFGADAAVRSEHGHTGAAGDIVLPLVGVGMPVRFTQRAGLDLHERAGDGRRDRKLALRYQAIGAARISVRALGEQAVAMGERPAIERAGPGLAGSGGGTGPLAI